MIKREPFHIFTFFVLAFSAFTVLLGPISALSAQSPPAIGTSTRDEMKLIAIGRKQFLQACSACHGTNAGGGDGPNLHHQSLTESSITYRITHGVKDEMPAFTKLTPNQLTALTKYIQSLQ
jgi:mono/diheme cytochrome c family protein